MITCLNNNYLRSSLYATDYIYNEIIIFNPSILVDVVRNRTRHKFHCSAENAYGIQYCIMVIIIRRTRCAQAWLSFVSETNINHVKMHYRITFQMYRLYTGRLGRSGIVEFITRREIPSRIRFSIRIHFLHNIIHMFIKFVKMPLDSTHISKSIIRYYNNICLDFPL